MRRVRGVVLSVLASVLLSAWVVPGASAAEHSVTTLPVSGIAQSSATAHCSVTTTIKTQVFVKWGKVGTTLVKSTVQYVDAPTSDVAFPLTGLTASTSYYVECRAYNSTYGTKVGAKISFQTAGGGSTEPPPTEEPPPSNVSGTTIVAVGDMCEPDPTRSCNPTGALATGLKPRLYALLGDMQYEKGTVAEFSNGYAKSTWNPVNGLSYPAIGNHEIQSGSDAGYCGYFTNANCVGAKRYYAYDIDANWRAIVLNSNTPSNATQIDWLKGELARIGRSKNLLVYWHHPRWENGGLNGKNNTSVNPLMQPIYAAGADIVLWGHDHLYERFAKMSPTGPDPAKGMRAFVVGTGGTSLRARVTANLKPGTEKVVRQFGVLKLTLGATSYAWQFHTVGGSIADSGTDTVTP